MDKIVYVLIHSEESYDDVSVYNTWKLAHDQKLRLFQGLGVIYERIIIGEIID